MKVLLSYASLACAFALLAACGGGKKQVPISFDLSGTLTFDSVPHASGSAALDYSSTVQKPIRGATVEAVSGSNVLASTTTDAGGAYSLVYDGTTTTGKTVTIRVRAQMQQSGTPAWNFQVLDNTNSSAAYVMNLVSLDPDTTTSAVVDANAASGWSGSSYTSARSAAPFAILDQVYDAKNKILATNSNAVFPSLNIYWSINNVPAAGTKNTGQIGASHWDGTSLYILGAANVDTDEYDTHVVLHEWGHYFETSFARSDSIGGSHSIGNRLDMRLAFSEGFCTALAGMISDDPLYKDSMGTSQGSGFTIDAESNSSTNPGWYSEFSVISLLYDLYDSNSDGSDSVSLGFTPIYDVLTSDFKSSDVLTSIFSFIPPLKTNNAAEASAIDTLVASQSMVSNTMDKTGSTETNNASTASNVLPVYTPASTGGVATNICTLNKFENDARFPVRNKLSYSRYLRFQAPTSKTYSINVSKTSSTSTETNADPDIYLYGSNGLIANALSAATNSETLATPVLAAGQYYTVVVQDWKLVGNSPNGSQSTCMDVTIN